ncbi:MAG: hypothetical protein ACM3QU_01810 [Verrucomicrobiota bacterium]
MPAAAPRIDVRLVAAIALVDDPGRPMAETNRRIGALAEDLGLSRPSYEQVRHLVKRHRRGRLDPTIGKILLEIAFRSRPPEALLDYLAGTPLASR